MQFDDIINKILWEELSDREKRIEALKHIVPSEAPGTVMYDVSRLKDFNTTQFPRVTQQDLVEENWGIYSIVFEEFNILFEVQYNCGKIEVYNDEDANIEDWEVVSIFANLRPIAGENYFVVLNRNTVPNLYQHIEEQAWNRVTEKEIDPDYFNRQPSFT
jgi:hypothetical protein